MGSLFVLKYKGGIKMNKKIFLMVLMSIFLFGLATTTFAGINNTVLQSPAVDAILAPGTGLTLVNVTFGNPSNLSVGCQLRVTSSSTANITGYTVFNFTNNRAITDGINQSNRTINLSSIIFEDATNYAWFVGCQGDDQDDTLTATNRTDNNTGITIDRTLPTTPTVNTPAAGSVLNSGDVLSFTVGGPNTTSCTLVFDNQPTITGTHAGNTCNYTINTYTLADKIYNNVRVTASDGTNTTTSSSVSYTIENSVNSQSPFAGAEIVTTDVQTAQNLGVKSGGGTNTLTIFGLLVLAYLIYKKNQR